MGGGRVLFIYIYIYMEHESSFNAFLHVSLVCAPPVFSGVCLPSFI